MPRNKIPKALREYLSKMKSPHRSPIHLPSKKWMVAGCKHPRTHSIDMDKATTNNVKDDEAMLADIDRFLFENFKSLFLEDLDDSNSSDNSRHGAKSPELCPIRFDSSTRFHDFHPALFTETTTEGGSSSTASENEGGEDLMLLPTNCVVVLANSASPSEDFRRSMEGVVESRIRNQEKVDWDFMEELLYCHMNLNHKKTHKYILNAFVDVVTAMRAQPESPDRPKGIEKIYKNNKFLTISTPLNLTIK
uniref:Transcription repressor n=1 Tax=Cajanus cajan TaxID=3821 RepID=A0A151SH84_CAJCA|nr:hypothetical protein KK1_000389 [Cajanus cajan]